MVLGLGLVSMGLDQVELVLDQAALVQVALGLAVLVLVVTDLVALDQVGMGSALLEQDWVVSEPGQVVMDRVVLAQDQPAMDQVEQGPVLVFILLAVKDWVQENHPNQVTVMYFNTRNKIEQVIIL